MGLERAPVLGLLTAGEWAEPGPVVSVGGTRDGGALALTTSGTVSLGVCCWLCPLAACCPPPLLLLLVALVWASLLFLSTELLTRLSLVEPLRCRACWEACLVGLWVAEGGVFAPL